MTLHDKSGGTDIAEHIMAEARADLVKRAKATDPLAVKRDDGAALDYLARKRADEASVGLARVQRWLTVALIFTLIAGVTLAVAAYADPVARLAHDTARSEYCGAC